MPRRPGTRRRAAIRSSRRPPPQKSRAVLRLVSTPWLVFMGTTGCKGGRAAPWWPCSSPAWCLLNYPILSCSTARRPSRVAFAPRLSVRGVDRDPGRGVDRRGAGRADTGSGRDAPGLADRRHSFAYLLLLFAVAQPRRPARGPGRSVIDNPWVSVRVAVYCPWTSSTASVGRPAPACGSCRLSRAPMLPM